MGSIFRFLSGATHGESETVNLALWIEAMESEE